MRVVLIGGNKGLGLSLKQRLEKEGHQVVALSRNSEIPLDLTWEEERVKEAVATAIASLGGVDALIAAGGLGAYHSPLVSADKVEQIMQTNFLGPTKVFRAAYKELLRSQGKAIFISSTAARRPGSGGLSYYGASKAALNSWVMSEGRRAAKHGVAICAVAPGFFESPMTGEMVPALKEATTKAIPFGRWGEIEEISDFIVALINQSNWCLSGQVFEISGGA